MKNFSCIVVKNATNCKSELYKEFDPSYECEPYNYLISNAMMLLLTIAFEEAAKVSEPSLTSNNKNLFIADLLLNEYYGKDNVKCLPSFNSEEHYFEKYHDCFDVTIYGKKLIIPFYSDLGFDFWNNLSQTITGIEIVLAITNIFEKMNISDFIQMKIATQSYEDMERKLYDYLTRKCCDFFDIKLKLNDYNNVQAINPEEEEYTKAIWFHAQAFTKEFLHIFKKELYK